MSSAGWTIDLVVYAHIGDLHITDADQPNYRDFLAIVGDIDAIGGTGLDFVFLPGDNADNGRADQYRLVADGLQPLRIPVFAISGDHDMETGSLAPFRKVLEQRTFPHTQAVRGTDCVFLDMSGAGKGGPDFRLPVIQTRHLQRAIEHARSAGRSLAVFAHTYPADLTRDNERAAMNALLAHPGVCLVDMGHTHYNEIANDGRTIFCATRSTGQIEEGPVGYSVIAIDGGAVSWRFKLLDDADPFVLITAPADRRLRLEGAPTAGRDIHAVVLGKHPVALCQWRGDGGAWQPMHATSDARGWEAQNDGTAERIEVRARDVTGRTGHDTIDLAESAPHDVARDGSDRDAIEPWPERHLLGTQLGPNRNGRKW